MARLRDTAKKMKEKLSANKQTPVTVEAISNDIDFRSKISREEFEEMNADLFERAVAPVRRLFEDSGLDVRSVDACVIVGGGSLMPKIQVRGLPLSLLWPTGCWWESSAVPAPARQRPPADGARPAGGRRCCSRRCSSRCSPGTSTRTRPPRWAPASTPRG
jgi:hypothetical protein